MTTSIARYRKKPVEIEAIQLDPLGKDIDQFTAAIAWCGGRAAEDGSGIVIDTLEGAVLARHGDYVICGVAGEFYPCKPGIFEQTYEAVEPVPVALADEGDDRVYEVDSADVAWVDPASDWDGMRYEQ